MSRKIDFKKYFAKLKKIKPTLKKRRLVKLCASGSHFEKEEQVRRFRRPDAPISKSQSLLILGRTKGTSAYEEMKDFHHESAAKAMSFLRNRIEEIRYEQKCKAKEAKLRLEKKLAKSKKTKTKLKIY